LKSIIPELNLPIVPIGHKHFLAFIFFACTQIKQKYKPKIIVFDRYYPKGKT